MGWWNSSPSLHAAWIVASILGLIAFAALTGFEIAEHRTDDRSEHRRHLWARCGIAALGALGVFDVATFVFELRRSDLDDGRITTAAADLELELESNSTSGSGNFLGPPENLYVAFAEGGSAVLVLRSTHMEWRGSPELHALVINGGFDLSSPYAQSDGHLHDVTESQVVEVKVGNFTDKKILRGTLRVVLNRSTRLNLTIPPQNLVRDGVFYIPAPNSPGPPHSWPSSPSCDRNSLIGAWALIGSAFSIPSSLNASGVNSN